MAFTHPTSQKLQLITSATQQATPPPAYALDPTFSTTVADFEEFDDEEAERLSSIVLNIKCPLRVTGHDNLIAMDNSLAASKIAMAVVSALKQMSMAGSGIPMIDEEGRPRPIKVDVDTSITIEGDRNKLGDAASVAMAKQAGVQSGVAGGSTSKREREESDSVEGEGKRARTQ
jgi:hypothetical protein